MQYIFSAATEALLKAGELHRVYSATAHLLPLVRDPNTGRFAEMAVGAVVNDNPLQPLIAPVQMVTGAAQMYQNHTEFTAVLNGLSSIQTSLGVLQATTALIGVGTVAGVALTAVNLHQTLRLRKEVEQLKLEVKNGFVDLKKALKDQGAEIRQLIEAVAQDIKFEQHRTILVQAYGLFIQAISRLRSAVQLQDVSRRNAEIDAARGMLFNALADYTNPHLLEETSAPGHLRRIECAWAIEQAIVTTYQAQKEVSAVSDRLAHLQNKIREDALTVIDRCETEDELDFIFPEITRIHNHDMAVLESWQVHVDWMRSLPLSELKLLQSADLSNSNITANSDKNAVLALPPEQLLYENLKQKSHPVSLELQLQFMLLPELREEYESYVSQQAEMVGYKTLVPTNLKKSSDLTVANLYWYFNFRDESEDELESSEENSLPSTPKVVQPLSNTISLKSAVGMDYSPLRDLLAAGKWREANEETRNVMLKVARREEEGCLDSNSIKNFPCSDLGTINQLWLDYSNGRFGFSVQKQIWLNCGGKGDYKTEQKLVDRLGWKTGIIYSLDAFPGHLPWSAPPGTSPSAALLSFFSLVSRVQICQL